MVTITTGVPGDGQCDTGADRFPSGKEKHLTFHIYSAAAHYDPVYISTHKWIARNLLLCVPEMYMQDFELCVLLYNLTTGSLI